MATEKVSLESASIVADRLAALRQVVPEAFSADGQVDFDKLKAALGETVEGDAERYRFTWAGKQDALRLLQSPSRATLLPCPAESINFGATGNVFIEGENLEVLKLLYKSYFGRVKMIYIDPPYNTGNDFIYPDDFSEPLANYLRLTGQVDAAGAALTSNREASGRFHSRWLSMMYPRLFIARQLLRDDGLIFVSIDDNEVNDLRMAMNEVFGEENFLAQISWKNVYGGGAKSKHVVPQHEYVVLYAKSKEAIGELGLPPDPKARARYTEKDGKYAVRGPYFTQPLATTSMDFRENLRFPILWKGEEIWPEKQWQWSKDRVAQALANDELVLRKENGKWSVRYKQYLRDEDGQERGAKLFSVLVGPWSQDGTAEIVEFFGDPKVFPFPKPSSLIRHLISCAWQDPNAIVLDFFAGSCPTAQAVLELNRQFGLHHRFVMVQIPEPLADDSSARKAGLKTIADIGKERTRRVIAKLQKELADKLDLKNGEQPEDLGFAVFKLASSNLRQWRGEGIKTDEQLLAELERQADPLPEKFDAQAVIYEVAVKQGLSLTSRIGPVTGIPDNTIYRVEDADRGQHFYICLDEQLSNTAWKALSLKKDDLFICRDRALDDTKAANLALQCRLKTI